MEIKSFKINGQEAKETYEAAVGQCLKLEWDCPDCDFCVIYPYNWTVNRSGQMEFYIYETMTLVLRAVKGRDSMQKELLAKVSGEEDLKGVDVSPSGPAAAGIKTEFNFDLVKTKFGYLDHGIGRIEGDSYNGFLRHQYGIYRYNILSVAKEIQFKEKTVKAGRSDALELQRLKYVIMQNGNERQYELSWRVVNNDGKEVIIETSDHKNTFDKNSSGRASFARTGGETVTLSIRCDTEGKGNINFAGIYPFEVK